MPVPEEFAAVPGLDELYIFGSWAARYLGHPGPTPAGIDVLVVGPADRNHHRPLLRLIPAENAP